MIMDTTEAANAILFYLYKRNEEASFQEIHYEAHIEPSSVMDTALGNLQEIDVINARLDTTNEQHYSLKADARKLMQKLPKKFKYDPYQYMLLRRPALNPSIYQSIPYTSKRPSMHQKSLLWISEHIIQLVISVIAILVAGYFAIKFKIPH